MTSFRCLFLATDLLESVYNQHAVAQNIYSVSKLTSLVFDGAVLINLLTQSSYLGFSSEKQDYPLESHGCQKQ